jgi:hypothetical protein
MNKIIVLFLLISIISCKKETLNNIPSYITIESITIDDNSTLNNITDAWVYIDDDLQGVYELPANFPVLAEGEHKLRIKAGIKDNGIASTRVSYPFYSSYIIENHVFNPELTISISPEVSYLENVNFFIEDFEGAGIDLEATSISDTSIIEFDNGINKYGGGVLIDSLITFEITTDELRNLPQAGAPVYLELDYKCNTPFLVGVYINFPQSAVLQKDLLWITPKEDWNKIYITLTSTISEAVGADFFKIFFSMKRDFTLDKNTIYFDNIKVVY